MKQFNRKSIIVDEIKNIAINTGSSYIDSCILWCEKNNFEIETLAELIKENQVLKYNIELEAQCLHYIKKTSRLPFFGVFN